MWPALLDYTEDECRKLLRKLELEAYSSVISAFRAQGEMNKEKKKMLQELSGALSVSLERHKAEIRRAVNDQALNTISYKLVGPNTSTEWAIEGRRVIPLMPRRIPQTDFTAVADEAAKAYLANPTIGIAKEPTFIDIPEKEIAEGKYKRKSSNSPEPCVPAKKIALDNSYLNSISSSKNDVEETPDMFPRIPSPIPQCVLQAVLGKDNLYRPTEKKTKSMVTSARQESPNATLDAFKQPPSTNCLPVSSYPCLPSTSKAILPSPFLTLEPMCSKGCITRTTIGIPSSIQISPVKNASNRSQTQLMNSISAPLFTVPAVPPPIVSPSLSSSSPRTRSKVFMSSKQTMRPRLFSGTMNPSQQVSGHQQGASPQMPSPSMVQSSNKGAPQLRNRGTSTMLRTSSISSSTALNTFPGQKPPITTALQKVSPVLTNSFRPQSSNQVKQSPLQNKSPKNVNKTTSLKQPPLSARTLLTPKPPMPKNTTPVVVPSSTASRPSTVQSSLKPAVSLAMTNRMPLQSLPTKSVSTQLQTQNQSKSNSTSVAKMIHYRNDSGLKIISQNVPSSRILPKPSTSVPAQCSSSTPSNTTNKVAPTTLSNVNVTANARIVNFTQPVARFTRAVIPSAISTVNLTNTLPTTGLRVTLPPVSVNSSSVIRAGIPAKPNVIVVHKAQVWPQTPGATIVMTSTGPLTRISNEAIEEAVNMMQRQDSSRLNPTSAATTFKAVTLQQAAITAPGISNIVSVAPRPMPFALTTTTKTAVVSAISSTKVSDQSATGHELKVPVTKQPKMVEDRVNVAPKPVMQKTELRNDRKCMNIAVDTSKNILTLQSLTTPPPSDVTVKSDIKVSNQIPQSFVELSSQVQENRLIIPMDNSSGRVKPMSAEDEDLKRLKAAINNKKPENVISKTKSMKSKELASISIDESVKKEHTKMNVKKIPEINIDSGSSSDCPDEMKTNQLCKDEVTVVPVSLSTKLNSDVMKILQEASTKSPDIEVLKNDVSEMWKVKNELPSPQHVNLGSVNHIEPVTKSELPKISSGSLNLNEINVSVQSLETKEIISCKKSEDCTSNNEQLCKADLPVTSNALTNSESKAHCKETNTFNTKHTGTCSLEEKIVDVAPCIKKNNCAEQQEMQEIRTKSDVVLNQQLEAKNKGIY